MVLPQIFSYGGLGALLRLYQDISVLCDGCTHLAPIQVAAAIALARLVEHAPDPEAVYALPGRGDLVGALQTVYSYAVGRVKIRASTSPVPCTDCKWMHNNALDLRAELFGTVDSLGADAMLCCSVATAVSRLCEHPEQRDNFVSTLCVLRPVIPVPHSLVDSPFQCAPAELHT